MCTAYAWPVLYSDLLPLCSEGAGYGTANGWVISFIMAFVAGWRHALRSEWPFIIIMNYRYCSFIWVEGPPSSVLVAVAVLVGGRLAVLVGVDIT